jgi:hypothetical protein
MTIEIPDPAPIKVALYGDNFAAVTSPRIAISASGPGCLRTVANQLLNAGFDAASRIEIFRAGDRTVGSVALVDAATGATKLETA